MTREGGGRKEEGGTAIEAVPSSIPMPSPHGNMPGPPPGYNPELERIEVELLLEGIFRQYGFDFRSYAYASMRRRLWKRVEAESLANLSELGPAVDRFFTDVLVMTDDRQLRTARLSLMAHLRNAVLRIGDVSEVVAAEK